MQDASPTRRPAVLVLGMHRSGTSALTRVLSLHGLTLPARVMQPAPDNPRGFWESAAVAALDDRILAAAGSRYDDPRPLPPGLLPDAEREAFIAEALALLGTEFPGTDPFVLKDPRICRLLDVWRPALERFGAAPLALLPVRNPLEVVRSLEARQQMPKAQALLLWLSHVVAAEQGSRGLPRAVVHYDDLLRDWRGFLARLGVPVLRDTALETVAFLTPALRHHEADTDTLLRDAEVPAAVKRVYAELRRAPAEPGLDPEPFDAAAAWLATA
ncbi:sulfotransferase family protein [Roseomonas frigidaquae]|uniref:Sulfotransferase family protein n=1 Tax=Falsiroseomonas frigidaquae TaxID=487318 RepID=A0ABX1F5R5_9PROT|nr:sulfotransferase family protein [Falsiroseomonas frigidaquae]NKE47566.1 sulfotransferase family protein [Falsiroseomonas frigidaquae]